MWIEVTNSTQINQTKIMLHSLDEVYTFLLCSEGLRKILQ